MAILKNPGLVIIGGSLGGLAAAAEVIRNGGNPKQILILEKRNRPMLLRSIGLDCFALDIIEAAGVDLSLILALRPRILIYGDYQHEQRVRVPLGQPLFGPQGRPSLHIWQRQNAGVTTLGVLIQALSERLSAQGVTILNEAQVTGLSQQEVEPVVVTFNYVEKRHSISADKVYIAAGAAGSRELKLDVGGNAIKLKRKKEKNRLIDGLGAVFAATHGDSIIRLVRNDPDRLDVIYAVGSGPLVSIGIACHPGHLSAFEKDFEAFAARAAAKLDIFGKPLQVFRFTNSLDVMPLINVSDRIQVGGDAARRSDPIFGGGGNGALADAYNYGQLYAGKISIEQYVATIRETTSAVHNGSKWVGDTIAFARQASRLAAIVPSPIRRYNDWASALFGHLLEQTATRLMDTPDPRAASNVRIASQAQQPYLHSDSRFDVFAEYFS
ncbi:MAG TPA: FAD-dependent monooxygenase [Anaerolineae bacterium]|jgi:2-polyprenyl-6-methoxyphenol hydroxylase-like FAD-dependent oxidoreductase